MPSQFAWVVSVFPSPMSPRLRNTMPLKRSQHNLQRPFWSSAKSTTLTQSWNSNIEMQVRSEKGKAETAAANSLHPRLPQNSMLSEVAKEKGSSSWLAALPIESHGFSLHKGAFRDALCLRYGRQPILLPTTCACGKLFTVDHVLNCPTGGFPIVCHNEIQDLTAELIVRGLP